MAGIPEGELGLGEGARSHEAPFMGGGGAEQGHGGDQDDRQGDAEKPPPDQLAPHVDVVGQGLAAPERRVAEHHRVLPFKVCGTGAVTAPGDVAMGSGERPGKAGPG